MRTSQKSITEVCRTLICSLEARAAKVSVLRAKDSLLRTIEETCFLTISKSLKPSAPVTLSLKTYPTCLVYRRGNVSESSLKRFLNWGIVCAGVCLTLPDSGYRSQEEGCSLSDILETDVPQKYWLSEENCEKGKPEQLIGGSQGQRVYSTDGTAVTQCSGSGGLGGKTGLYFIDCNPNPQMTDIARCITARQDSGVSKHKGEHSAVVCDLNENPQITENARCLHTRMDLGVTNGTHKGERSGVLEEAPRAIINPFKETTRQNGRRIKNPDEPMFTLTVTDRHGIVHKGRIRRLMPIECWRLQGFTTEQFRKVEAVGMSDAQLYKQAGNSITVNVVEAIARNLLKFDEEENANEEYDKNI